MLIQNAVICPDGTILKSIHRHDFHAHNGIVVDGGLEYLRRGGEGGVDISLSTSDTIEEVYEHMAVDVSDGIGKYIWKLAAMCTTDELKQALRNINTAFPNNSGGYVIHMTISAIHFHAMQKYRERAKLN